MGNLMQFVGGSVVDWILNGGFPKSARRVYWIIGSVHALPRSQWPLFKFKMATSQIVC